ncbi:hypothetical protein FEM48_Zijuj04G0009000 [Ziziphus jujuba var. spinosa]|uniref:SPARK domain-containing protein n=1 Tax=Ziziphus jujuba var. spinosa TaxID=714518 RepID=A0A978VGW7_ZIZJJ|nr:hypothetical protein FEM48_Zijuj04G0009000 [Ziziphus jujuba var. spinosa]
MSRFWFFFLILHALLLLFLLVPSFSQKNGNVSCLLNFTVIRKLASNAGHPNFDVPTTCKYVIQSLRLVKSVYLQATNNFAPPLNSSESCWSVFQLILNHYSWNFDIRSSCGFQTSWISEGCMNITNRTEFKHVIPKSMIDTVIQNCNQSLANGFPCASCTTSLSNLQALYLTGPFVENVSDCMALPSIYAGAFTNYLGPTYLGTTKYLWFRSSFEEIQQLFCCWGSSFAHEVEVIASVRHVNLVALRSYCIATIPMEVRDGKALDVIEDDMPDKGPPQVLEKYVLVAVLYSHPQLYARPTMDQAVKMLEMDMSIPSTPKRPVPLVAELSDVERSVSTSCSGTIVSPRSYSSYTYESDRPLELEEERQTSSSRVEELS